MVFVKIGTSTIYPLIDTLKEWNWFMRISADELLWSNTDAHAFALLIEVLMCKDEDLNKTAA